MSDDIMITSGECMQLEPTPELRYVVRSDWDYDRKEFLQQKYKVVGTFEYEWIDVPIVDEN